MKRALVLSGGGAKGAYQLGVYKALKKLHIKIHIVTGTSIGSINGALLVSGNYHKAKKLWQTLSFKDLFDYDVNDSSNYAKIAKEMFQNKGLKFDKAEKYLSSVVDENKIRRSKIDYGLVTVNLKNMVPKMLTKSQIPNGKLISYIIASSTCFPLIERKDIDGEYYIDGGYYDNMPINLAIDMGADEVIAVDLSAIGIGKKVKNENIKIDYIKHTSKGTFILDFDPEVAKKNMILGYNDTMKHYKKFDGSVYTFKKGNLLRNYNSLSDIYIKLIEDILSLDVVKVSDSIKNKRYENILLNIKQGKSLESEVNSSLEYLASLFELSETHVYNIDYFNRLLIKEAESLNYITIDKNLKGKMLIGYIYNKYMNSNNKKDVYKKLFNIALVFQKDFLAAIYLIAISDKYSSYYSKVNNNDVK